MTDYPCRLPDGRIGTTFRQVEGEWVALCVR